MNNTYPIIHIFNTFNSKRVFDFFKKNGIEVFVDDKNHDVEHFKGLVGDNGRAYLLDSKVKGFRKDDLEKCEIYDFFITFQEGVVINDEKWQAVLDTLNDGLGFVEYSVDRVKCGMEILQSGICVQNVVFENGSKQIAPELPKIEGGYEFRSEYLSGVDCKVYEVKRPGTDKPFVVVVYEWSKKGDEYFFTDIYGSKEWDMNRRECRFDYTFLKELWKNMGLDGEFNMDLLRKRVERCYPTEMLKGKAPEGEPMVYRLLMCEVVKRIKSRW